ncbi:Putative uncharacterized protein [Taphrina deformans PYCC 5710]|uniref:Trafficking protein particle complex II-specific subunit 65 IgD3 domain-containing protein n=1 Tax=Taphrina deformans (strain PYCC 5710 / ATCC 11124 / CBS 356.35 / IMI 108563 / JCM 9778 / NBRC 8474) TaxID=1097556 RepID=S0BE46_TAPDE|nr:Putative uncharacterized protein [Taphrina deformans PYCC 5710]|eukprot:CCG81555.1 Putative uncharacterized protein [Taphrina deformans PYCC 5710]
MTLSDKAFDEPNANAYIDSTDMTGRDMSYNLLRGLESDVFLRDNPPELSAARVSTMRPLADPMTKKTKKSAKRVFSVHSAIALRIRSFDIPASSRVILSIDLESPEDSKHALEFHSIELQVNQAKPNPIGECSFPFDLKDGEKYTYAFDLNFENLPVEIGGHIPATLIIHSRPVTHESESIRGPLLISKWSTTISVPQDVGTPLTHHLEDVARQRMQRSSSNLLQAARSSMLVSPSDSQTPLSGIVVTLRPPANGRIGQVIDIPVLVTNNASTPKTLNIDVSRAPRKKELPRAPLSESGSRALVLSDQALHETHAQCSAEGIDFICLTNHIKIGQLAGGAQVEVTLQYLAMREAIVELQDLRIVDVSSGVYHELKDLSTIHITT